MKSLIMGIIGPEHLELFAIELGKIAEFNFVYTLASTNINQSVPNSVTMYVTIRLLMSSTMDLIISELFELICPLTLSQTSPGFYVSAVQVFLKTLWEKEKLLVTSNFSFSHSVLYPFRELPVIFIKFEIVVWKLFQFGRVKSSSFGRGVTGKIAIFDFVYTLAPANIDQSAPNLVTI